MVKKELSLGEHTFSRKKKKKDRVPFFLFSTSGEHSVNRKELRALTLVGPIRDNPILDPLAVLHLHN